MKNLLKWLFQTLKVFFMVFGFFWFVLLAWVAWKGAFLIGLANDHFRNHPEELQHLKDIWRRTHCRSETDAAREVEAAREAAMDADRAQFKAQVEKNEAWLKDLKAREAEAMKAAKEQMEKIKARRQAAEQRGSPSESASSGSEASGGSR